MTELPDFADEMTGDVRYRRIKDNEERNEIFSNMSFESSSTNTFKSKKFTRRHLAIALAVVALFIGLIVGFIIGYFVNNKQVESPTNGNPTKQPQQSNDDSLIQSILNSLDKNKIKENLRIYTSRPRMSGTPGGNELVDILANSWRNYGIDNVRVTPYDVLMSYPNVTNPNKIQLVTTTDEVVFQSRTFEAVLTNTSQGLDQSEIVLPFNAFAPGGIVTGDLVYVNYGRIEDFLLLKNLSVNVEGKIVIARYGKIFRGNKVKNAEIFNASGVLMYTDPSDFNIHGTNGTYPSSWWMPSSGVQRGTVGIDGDYLTPFYPATEYAHRKNVKDLNLPKIPAQPISYGDALHLLREMKGQDAPAAWQGKLPVTYKLGPGFSNNTLKAKLIVNNFEEVRRVYNVIGYIRGSVEPDRYVLLGNHHDAWVFGAIDPLSGAASLTDIIRVLSDIMKKGIRPRRTIVFCSWGAEEHGLTGSTEWVEEYMKVLYERAVAYLNVDYACDYHYVLTAGTSPLLQDSLYMSARKVPNPDASSSKKTLYDIWNYRSNKNPSDKTEPSVYYSLGSGSDMATFYQRAGVPSIDMWYTYNEDEWDILSYPTYHSAYETFYYYEKFIDPSFNYTLTMARLWAVMAWDLANKELLPFDVRRYATAIDSFLKELKNDFGTIWQQKGIRIEDLESASKNLTDSANTFHSKIPTSPSEHALENRILNDKMIQMERAFIDPEGLPDRRIYKHVMFAPSSYDSYSDKSFPGIYDTMFDIQNNNKDKWDQLKEQVYIATYTIQSVANTLDDIGL